MATVSNPDQGKQNWGTRPDIFHKPEIKPRRKALKIIGGVMAGMVTLGSGVFIGQRLSEQNQEQAAIKAATKKNASPLTPNAEKTSLIEQTKDSGLIRARETYPGVPTITASRANGEKIYVSTLPDPNKHGKLAFVNAVNGLLACYATTLDTNCLEALLADSSDIDEFADSIRSANIISYSTASDTNRRAQTLIFSKEPVRILDKVGAGGKEYFTVDNVLYMQRYVGDWDNPESNEWQGEAAIARLSIPESIIDLYEVYPVQLRDGSWKVSDFKLNVTPNPEFGKD